VVARIVELALSPLMLLGFVTILRDPAVIFPKASMSEGSPKVTILPNLDDHEASELHCFLGRASVGCHPSRAFGWQCLFKPEQPSERSYSTPGS
jgi:hypothetical protein